EERLRPALKGLHRGFRLHLGDLLHRAGPGVDTEALAGKIRDRHDAALLSDAQGLWGVEIGDCEIDDPVARSIVAYRGDEEIQPLLLQQLDAVGAFDRLELELDAEPPCDVHDQIDLEAGKVSFLVDEAEVRRVVLDASSQDAAGLD